MSKNSDKKDKEMNEYIKRCMIKAIVINEQLKRLGEETIVEGENYGLLNFVEFIMLNPEMFEGFDIQNNLENENLLYNYIIPISKDEFFMMYDVYIAAVKKKKQFELTSKMKEEIARASLEAIIELNKNNLQKEQYLKNYIKNYDKKVMIPENPVTFTKKLSEGTLVEDKEAVKKKLEISDEDLDILNKSEQIKEINKTLKKNEEDRNDEIKLRHLNVPEYAREMISIICRENPNLDIKDLKHVIEVRNSNTLGDNVKNMELTNFDGKAYQLVFRDHSTKSSDRVVAVQKNKIIDERVYDRALSGLADDKRHKAVVENLENYDHKIDYTDLDGNTFEATIQKEPRDMMIDEKIRLIEKLKAMDRKEQEIFNGNLSVEDTFEAISDLQQERLDTLKDSGIKMPSLESEIKADKEVANEIADNSDKVKDNEKGRSLAEEAQERLENHYGRYER